VLGAITNFVTTNSQGDKNMPQILYSSKLSLYDIETKFNLKSTDNEQFFQEWLNDLPELNSQECQRLDEVKSHYLYLSKRPMLEVVVKMLVLSPLLELAGFYDPPFFISAEEPVEISVEEKDELIKGQIDILAVQGEFWIAVVESKRAKFNVMEALPQTLTYMMATPHPEKPVFGLMTSGDHSLFVKLTRQDTPQYALSDSFFLFDRGNALYNVLQILKHLGQLTLAN
jgi:hypothetical protein